MRINPGRGPGPCAFATYVAPTVKVRYGRTSGLGTLTLIVFPLQQPAGDEAIDRLAGCEPGVAQPGMTLQDSALDRGQVRGAVRALVLEQVAQVLTGEQTHPARTRVAAGRELEVDDRRRAVIEYQPVGFLGQVVMRKA